MPTESEHSELPWIVEGNHLMDNSGRNTIAVFSKGWSDDEANMQFVKDACNNYEALCAELEKVNKHLDFVRQTRDEATQQINEANLGLATTLKELEKMNRERDEWREHAALTDKELLQMQDWLISNAEFDPKIGLIDRCTKLKERIRDLIACEGELGDLKKELAMAQKETARLDWLELQVVEVRTPLQHGSRHSFWASPTEDDEPSNLRQDIDNAIQSDKERSK